MAKKGFHLDKVNSDFLKHQKVFFATKHEKQKILEPLFKKIEMSLVDGQIDTDLFGTFSGEVERTGSMKEALRAKIKACLRAYPEAQFVLASEGSFMPHPFLGLIPSNLEALMLWCCETETEIYAEHLSVGTVHAEETFSLNGNYSEFLGKIGFPEQHVIVRPEKSYQPIFKGLRSEKEVSSAILACVAESPSGRFLISTDLRATGSPTRRSAILKVGEVLVSKLKSICPECHHPGFGIIRSLPGLECEECGEPTLVAKSVCYSCPRCFYESERPRPDQLAKADPGDCSNCNP